MDLKKIRTDLFVIPALLFFTILAVPYTSSAQIYFTEDQKISVIQIGETESQVITEADAYGLAVDLAGEHIYWSESDGFGAEIKRAALDGSNVTVINDQSESARGLALDLENSKIYWVDLINDGKILRADLSGENMEILVAGESDGFTDGTLDLSLDLENEKMYWVKRGAVMRANLDGSNIETAVEITSYVQPPSVELNPRDGYVYWVDGSNDNIMRASTETGEASTLISADEPSGISIDVENNLIFWNDEFFMEGTGQVSVANLDGSGVQMITETGFTRGAIFGSGWQMPTTSENITDQPRRIKLSQNYPNPFNPNTVIEYRLPKSMKVNLTIHNALGQQVAVLAENTRQQSGIHQISFDASNLTSGIYFYRIQAGEFSLTKMMTLLK